MSINNINSTPPASLSTTNNGKANTSPIANKLKEVHQAPVQTDKKGETSEAKKTLGNPLKGIFNFLGLREKSARTILSSTGATQTTKNEVLEILKKVKSVKSFVHGKDYKAPVIERSSPDALKLLEDKFPSAMKELKKDIYAQTKKILHEKLETTNQSSPPSSNETRQPSPDSLSYTTHTQNTKNSLP